MRPARQRMRCRHGYRVMLAPSDQTYHRPDLDYREQPTGQWVDYHKWQPARPTVTFIGTVAIGFTLYELTEHVDVRYVNGQYVRVDHAPRTRRSHRRILKAAGLPPVPHRPTSWQTFLKAHWGVIAGADFFTSKSGRGAASSRATRCSSSNWPPGVSTCSGRRPVRVSSYGASRPDDDGGRRRRAERPWCADLRSGSEMEPCVRQQCGDAGIRVVLIPARAPNANAYAERFVRSIKEECLDRMIPLGERHVRRAITEFVEHYHLERNHKDSPIG
jgi:hypothetical protein